MKRRNDRAIYDQAMQLAIVAEREVQKLLSEVLASLGDPYLIRASLEKPRRKSFESVLRRAKDKGWSLEQTLDRNWDTLGFRVVCNNLQDVRRTADLVKPALAKLAEKVAEKDYITNPLQGTYRAIHFTCYVPIKLGKAHREFGCEIQIRTRLQDAFATLSRADFYRVESTFPEEIKDDLMKLAESLRQADEVAESIRQRITVPVSGKAYTEGEVLTREAFAFL